MTMSAQDTTALPHQLFEGTTWHSRLLPSVNRFVYPYRYWGVNISALAAGQELPEINTTVFDESKVLGKLPLRKVLPKKLLAKGLPLFSAKKKALQRFCADDYLQHIDLQSNNSLSDAKKFDSNVKSTQALAKRLSRAFEKHAGSAPKGDMLGLLVCRNAGMYFSPVNFYLGFGNYFWISILRMNL